jgi:hypothetical protein
MPASRTRAASSVRSGRRKKDSYGYEEKVTCHPRGDVTLICHLRWHRVVAALARIARIRRLDRSASLRTAERVEPGATPHSALYSAQGVTPGSTVQSRGCRPTPSTIDAATVLGGVKGAFASLTGCTALDPACARCLQAIVDGVGRSCRDTIRMAACEAGHHHPADRVAVE